jgi:ribosome-binding ATPase YchF (GTP1/OBG family)
MKKEGVIDYEFGDNDFTIVAEGEKASNAIKRLDKVRDNILYRFGSTGVWSAVQKCVKLCNPVVVYPVRSLTNYTANSIDGDSVLSTAVLVPSTTSARSFAYMVHPEIGNRAALLPSSLSMHMNLCLYRLSKQHLLHECVIS